MLHGFILSNSNDLVEWGEVYYLMLSWLSLEDLSFRSSIIQFNPTAWLYMHVSFTNFANFCAVSCAGSLMDLIGEAFTGSSKNPQT